MAVNETLNLDLSKAFSQVRNLDEALSSAAGHFSQGIARAVGQLQGGKLNVDASGIQQVASGARQASADLGRAKEEAGGLGASLRRAAEVAGGLGIAVGAREIKEFFQESITGAASLIEIGNRLKVVFGDSASQVEAFGETSLESFGLAKRTALETAAGFGDLFTSLGVGRKPALDMSLAVTRLAGDLVSFKDVPIEEALVALRSGIVGEIEPLRRMGVSFNALQVEAKAAELGLIDSTGAATEAGKVQARFALILDQTKNSQGDFARTADSAANRMRTVQQAVQEAKDELGAGLLPEVVDATSAFLEMLPALTSLASGGFGLVGTAVQGVLPFMQVLGLVLDSLPSELTAAAVGAVALGRGFATVGAAKGLTGVALADFTALGAALGAAAPLARSFGGEIGQAGSQMLSSAAAGALLGTTIGGPGLGTAVGAAAGGLLGLASSLGLFGDEADDSAEKTKALIAEIEKLGKIQAAQAFLDDLGGFDLSLGRLASRLREISRDSPAAGQRVAAGLQAIGISDERLTRAVAKGTAEFKKSNVAKDQAHRTNQALAGSALGAATAEDTLTQRLTQFIDAAVGKLPTADTALATSQEQLKGFGLALDSSVSPEVFAANLQAVLDSIAGFPLLLQALIDRGLTNVASFVAGQGPEIGGQLARGILDGSPEVAAAINDTLAQIPTAVSTTQSFLEGQQPLIAQALQGGFTTAAARIPDLTAVGMANAGQAVTDAAPGLGTAGQTAGQAASGGFGTGVSGIPGEATTALTSAADPLSSALGLPIAAAIGGNIVGITFGAGIASGIASQQGIVETAARKLVDAAVEAGRKAAEAASPSKRAAREVGLPIAAGTAAGIDSGRRLVAKAQRGLVDSAFAVGTLTRAFSGALAGAGLGQVTVVKVGSMQEALAFVPASVRSDTAFLEG